MQTGVIGKQIIQIALAGMAGLQKQLDTVSAQLTKTATQAKAVGTSATQAFGQASGAVLGFARAADPLGSLQLDIAFARISVQIGRIFIPILREAAVRLGQVADFLNGLSDDTRESIVHWAKLGLVVVGAVAGFAKIAGVIGTVAGGFSSLVGVLTSVAGIAWKLLGFFGPWGRVAVIVAGVAAAFLGLSSAGEDAGSVVGKLVTTLKATWTALDALFGRLWDIASPALDKLVDGFQAAGQEVYQALVEAWERLAPVVMPLVNRLVQGVEAVFGKLGDVVGALFAGAVDGVGGGLGLLVNLFKTLLPVAEAVFVGVVRATEGVLDALMAVGQAIEAVGRFVRPLGDALTTAFAAVVPLLDKLRNTAKTTFQGIRDAADGLLKPVADAFEAVRGPLTAFFDKVSELGSALGTLFGAVADLVGTKLTEAFGEVRAAAGPVLDFLTDKLNQFLTLLTDGFQAAYGPIRNVFNSILLAFTVVVNAIRNAFYDMLRAITDRLNSFIDRVRDVAEAINAINPTNKKLIVPGRIDIGNRPDDAKPTVLPDQPPAKKPVADPFLVDIIPGKPLPPPDDAPAKKQLGLFERLLGGKGVVPEKKPGEKSQFTGDLLGTAKFTGIADAMRNAQQSTTPTKETAILEEQLKQTGKQVGLLEQIRDQLAGKEFPGPNGMLV